MQNSENRLNTAWWALRVLFGFVPIASGLDKFLNFLTNWQAYLNRLATKVIPVSPATFMHIVGVIEIIAGVVVLSQLTKIGAYVVMVWLVAVALNPLMMGKFLDVAVRDLGLAIAAFSLAQLTAVRQESTSRIRAGYAQPSPNRVLNMLRSRAREGRFVRLDLSSRVDPHAACNMRLPQGALSGYFDSYRPTGKPQLWKG